MKNSNIERKLPAEKRILSGNHFLSAEAVLIILCHHEKTIQLRVKKNSWQKYDFYSNERNYE